ncbi:hypothetical protein BpHYR1_035880 [Brachionus plicatilis]|uniref:Uncharacterized protein n=1 Tax=Brachionus plicatilis TaxID=10195 RepID=A0A3M7QUC0_BRAPC|nr:hypothetical protein BpHYR1_035880 [Brachionus plicatilis]
MIKSRVDYAFRFDKTTHLLTRLERLTWTNNLKLISNNFQQLLILSSTYSLTHAQNFVIINLCLDKLKYVLLPVPEKMDALEDEDPLLDTVFWLSTELIMELDEFVGFKLASLSSL